MTREEQDVMELLPLNGPTSPGFGPPSEMTKQLMAMGYIDIETMDDGMWRARITPRGKKALQER